MAPEPTQLLLVENNLGDAWLVCEALRGADLVTGGCSYRVTVAGRLGDAIAALGAKTFDVIVLDLGLPDSEGIETFKRVQAAAPDTAVVVLTRREDESSGPRTLREGAQDYLMKEQLDGPSLLRSLRDARDRKEAERDRLRLARAETARAEAERHRATLQAALAEADLQRTRLRATFEQAPVAVSVLTAPDQVFELANARYEAMVGRGNLAGKTFRQAFPELSPDAPPFAMIDRVFATGEPFASDEYHVRLDRGGGGLIEDVYFLFTCQPVRDAAGHVSAVITVAVDVTSQVTGKRRIEEANRARDEFLSVASHELRTPLNAILGWARMLRTGSVPEDRRDRAIETIERNARVQAQLVEDILDLSRITTGKLRIGVEPVDVVQVADAALDVVRPAADAKGVSLRVLPDPDAGIVRADAARLQQVVWNLLANAVKFTPSGGRVDLRLDRDNSHVAIAVSDTGRGIERRFLPHVFEPFRQADGSITRTHGGLGLGLAIVKHLVELHGGQIEARSDGLGRGATFIVRIPIATALSTAVAGVLHTPRSMSSWPVGRLFCPPEIDGLRVLVVDDESDARELLESILGQCKAQVTTARSAGEAFDLLTSGRPDVLVSDIGMPEEDGYGLIRRVRALPPASGGRTPAIALTAYARVEDRTRALMEGFTNHVTKPVEPQELIAVVAAAAGRDSRA